MKLSASVSLGRSGAQSPTPAGRDRSRGRCDRNRAHWRDALRPDRSEPERFARFGVGAFFQILARAAKAIEQAQDGGEPGVGESKSRIERDRLAGKAPRPLHNPRSQNLGCSRTCAPASRAHRRPGCRSSLRGLHAFLRAERGVERFGDSGREFALQVDRVRQRAIVAFSPNLVSIPRIDQARHERTPDRPSGASSLPERAAPRAPGRSPSYRAVHLLDNATY